MTEPLKPTGLDNEANFMGKLHEKNYGEAAQLRTSQDISVIKSASGIFLRLRRRISGGSTRQGPFQIDSVQDDYLTCYPFDNVNLVRTSATPVYIAKEELHQTDITQETIFGIVHNYTYTPGLTPPGGLAPADVNNVFRTDSVTGEFQLLTPPWQCGAATGEIIWADATPGLAIDGPAGPVTLLIAGRSAQWSQVTS